MSKKDYQAIARVIYGAREMIYRDPSHDEVRNALLQEVAEGLSDVFKADNSAFSRERFIEACETGACKGMKRREVA